MNSLTHHDDRFRRSGGSAEWGQLSRRNELSWIDSLEVDVNSGLISVLPLFKGPSSGKRSFLRRSILHFGNQVLGVDIVSYHGVVRRVENFLDKSSEAFLGDGWWSNFLNWCLELAIRENLIYGGSYLLVGKVGVQDKCLVALLPGSSRQSVALFLTGVSCSIHCSGTLSLLESLRSRNRSNWCRSQCRDERRRWLRSTSLKLRSLSAIDIDDKSRRVRLCLGSHRWWFFRVSNCKS